MLGAGLTVLAILAAGPSAAPVLTDPAEARTTAESAPVEAYRKSAEVHLLLGDFEGAHRRLDPYLGTSEPRTQRLIADLLTAEGRQGPAHDALDALAGHPGWEKHAEQQRARLERRRWQRLGGRIGLGLFAACVAILALGGARELLGFHVESVAVLAGGIAAVLTARTVSLGAALVMSLVAVASVALVHAAAATKRRTRPGPRGRLLIATLVVLGVGGAWGAVVLQIGPHRLLDVLLAGA